MKKVIGTLAVIGFLFVGNNVSASSKGSLFLVGKIAAVLSIYVDPVIGSTDVLDIENGESGRLIANVDEETNNEAGYRVDMESINAGALVHSNTTSSVAYTISYDSAAVLSPGAVGTPTAVKTVAGPLAGLTTATSAVNIDVTAGGTSLPAGTYTDTLIFTIVAL